MFGLFGPPSKKKFASLLVQEIQARGGHSFSIDLEKFEIRSGSIRGFLGNVYVAYCQASRSQRRHILENFVGTMAAQGGTSDRTFDEVASDVAIVVRERALFSFTSLLWDVDGVSSPPQPVNEPLTAWFAKSLVVDAPTHMSLVNQDEVERWGQTSDELFTLGLEKLTNAKPAHFACSDGVFRGLWNDDYDSSRILVKGIFDDLPINGDAVVCIPNRLTLLVADSADPAAVTRMIKQAEEIVRTIARPQNPAPLLVQDGVVSDYTVPPSSPCYLAVERAKRVAAALYYSEQKESLEKLYEKKGKDFFVATYGLSEFPDGTLRSSAVWTRDVPTLLPHTDEVVFVDSHAPKGQQVVARIPWDALVAHFEDRLLDTKMFPRRFFVSRFPEVEQIKALSSDHR